MVARAQTRRYSLILIFESVAKNGNETTRFAYQGYVAPVSTLRTRRTSWARASGALVAALPALAVLAASSDAGAYVVKKTSRGELVHWDEPAVSYTIDPSVNANVRGGSAATIDAMRSWSGTVGAPELSTIEADPVTAPQKPAFDYKNGIFFSKGGYTPAGRALAITVLTYDNASGRILDADVIFNGAYSFQVLEVAQKLADTPTLTHPSTTDDIVHGDQEVDVASDTVYDLHHVIAHELGHSLGMNDEMGHRDALMYRYSAPNDATIRQPGSDDIAGLAELYSTRLEAHGNGCGSATVAPKKPSETASRLASLATLGLLLFLVLRARQDRRARVGFVLATAAATISLVPSLSNKSGVASASEPLSAASLGHARAKVVSSATTLEDGLFKTEFKLATAECRTSTCPKTGYGATWGGTIGNITQEVGGYYAPSAGDDVDVSFANAPRPLGAIASPLAGRDIVTSGAVRVLTRASSL